MRKVLVSLKMHQNIRNMQIWNCDVTLFRKLKITQIEMAAKDHAVLVSGEFILHEIKENSTVC